jgi:hypothetical protein
MLRHLAPDLSVFARRVITLNLPARCLPLLPLLPLVIPPSSIATNLLTPLFPTYLLVPLLNTSPRLALLMETAMRNGPPADSLLPLLRSFKSSQAHQSSFMALSSLIHVFPLFSSTLQLNQGRHALSQRHSSLHTHCYIYIYKPL